MASTEPNINLFHEVKAIIDQGKQKIALSINANLTATYWHIGRLINQNILKEKRAEYGEQIIKNLSKELTREYGKGWSSRHLRHCLHFTETFPDHQIVSALWRQLRWNFYNMKHQTSGLQNTLPKHCQKHCLRKNSINLQQKQSDCLKKETNKNNG